MKHPAHSAFVAIFQAEVLLNTKRVAPYAMALLFGGNALLWWGWGPATGRGWATNADFFIAGALPVYSFMTLPLFTALIMADPVIRDFRTGFDQLIFSKPVKRAEYLLGKFFGNFFVLVCCQAAFVLTWFVLQFFRKPGMVVLEVRAFPYLKHFLVFVVVSHLVLAAIYFTVGTLTRNAKIVYGLGVCFYPLYITYQIVILKSLPGRWKNLLDPLLMNWGKIDRSRSAAEVNHLIITYDSVLIGNRLLMVLIAVICLAILYARFTIAERSRSPEKFSVLRLSTAAERVYYDSATLLPAGPDRSQGADFEADVRPSAISLPEVTRENEGFKANCRQLAAAMALEVRLLRSDRSLIVLVPLAVLVAFLSLPFSTGTAGASYSVSFAANTASGLLLFLLGVSVFFIGESMHRDREVKIESVVWSAPAPNNVFLLSKFFATLLLMLFLLLLAGLAAMLTQLLRGQTPIELSPYLLAYVVILLPSLAFIAAASIVLNVLLREKYLAYAVTTAIGGGLFYLYTQGYNRWPYNPVLYGLWTEYDLAGIVAVSSRLLELRLYCLALTLLSILIAHLFFERPTGASRRLKGDTR
jgi:ABC-2 type transport system permease protein